MARAKTFSYFTNKKYDGMMGRCYRESDPQYKNYGLRKIRVCSEWIQSCSAFTRWFKEQLSLLGVSEEEFLLNSRKYQLDRIDHNGHYTPTNCRIVSPQSNSRNRRNSRKSYVSAEGEIVCV